MKICIPTNGRAGMTEEVCQHFGRAPTFTVVDLSSGDIRILDNRSSHMGGMGLPPDMILGDGVEVMIVGGLGPKAVAAFSGAGVQVFVGAAGSVEEAIKAWKEGRLMRAGPDNACTEHRH